MPIPVCTAGADQSFAYSVSQAVTLAGSATNSPTVWEWTMLSVPAGSSDNVGVNGGFNNGVSSLQNPSFTAHNPGCYVLQLRAYNVSGWSDPDSEREQAQTLVFIRTQLLDLEIPNYRAYRYDASLLATLLDLETAANTAQTSAIHKATSGELNAMTEKVSPIGTDILVIEDSAASWAKKKAQISNLDVTDSGALHKATGGEIAALTEKGTPIGADLLVIEDSAASNAKKKVQITNLPEKVDSTAVHKATSGEISAMTDKAVPIGADLLMIEDSASSNAKKKLQVGNLLRKVLVLLRQTDTQYDEAGTSYVTKWTGRIAMDAGSPWNSFRAVCSIWMDSGGDRTSADVRVTVGSDTVELTSNATADGSSALRLGDIAWTGATTDALITVTVELKATGGSTGDAHYKFFELYGKK